MNETERALRLAQALDLRLQGQSTSTQPAVPDDQPLLVLAGRLSGRSAFAPTPIEQSQLRQRFTRYKESHKISIMNTKSPNLLKPTLTAVLWAALLIGISSVAILLITNLLGQPSRPKTGAAPTATVSPSPTSARPTASPEATSVKAVFPTQAQTARGIRMELREATRIGGGLRARLCYPAPDSQARLDGVDLKVGETSLTFYPSSSAQPTPGADGLTCETFVAAYPDGSPAGPWTITAQRLISPRESWPECSEVKQQIDAEIPGLNIFCDQATTGYGFSMGSNTESMNTAELNRRVDQYFAYNVRSGPWVFTFAAGDVATSIAAQTAPDPVVAPDACDPNVSRLDNGQSQSLSGNRANFTGLAGLGAVQSGSFTLQIGLVCDPRYSRLVANGDDRSEINGLGTIYILTYDGQPIDGEVKFYSGFDPFVRLSGGAASLSQGHIQSEDQGITFSTGIRPDFTQSDVRLRYLVKARMTDGALQGAVMSFTLQRAPEGYRPVDVQVEPLAAADLQTAESDPDAPLPFPTLPAQSQASQSSADTQALLDRMVRWQQPLISAPGWVHMRTHHEVPGGNALYAGATETLIDQWFQIDAQGQVVASIFDEHRMDGTPLQQVVAQNGKSINLTFGETGEFQSYPLDLTYAVKDTLKAGDQVKWHSVNLNGKAAILLVLNGMFTRRDAIDADSGAWLYTETVKLQDGDDPLTGGSLEDRATLEVAERVDAPPAEALALLNREPAGYTPPAPYGTPAPQGFDPSHSALSYRSVQGDQFNAPTFWYGDISADGYLLGRVDFGAVPGGYCDRSASGARLAFNYVQLDASGSAASNSLRWFDLKALDVIHQPAPEIVNIGVLSWSTTQEKLAVFGCKANQQGCGLYLLDPAADTVKLLLPDVYANWVPIWSPDGLQVAFVDTLKEGTTLYVVDIRTGQVVYQGQFDANAWQAPADSPTNTWGVAFPNGVSSTRCFEMK